MPEGAIDLSQGTGWGSLTGDVDGQPTGTIVPKYIVVQLPRPIDLGTGARNTAFAIDPSATCGDPGSSSTGDFHIQVSRTGASGSWTMVASRSGESNWRPRFRYTNVASSQVVTGVQYVRFWIDSPQVPDFATNCRNGSYGGCTYMDLTELEIFGVPSR